MTWDNPTKYDKGDQIRCSATFTNNSVDIDPTAVFFSFINAAGSESSYQYGVDGELVKDDTGDYHFDLDLDSVGTYRYRFYSTGTGKAAARSAVHSVAYD